MARRPAPLDAELLAYPTLSFHYGIGPEELARIPRPLVRAYLSELPRLIAGQQMRMMQATAYPNMKQEDQQALWNRWRSEEGLPEPPDENVPPVGAFTLAHYIAAGGGGGLAVRRK